MEISSDSKCRFSMTGSMLFESDLYISHKVHLLVREQVNDNISLFLNSTDLNFEMLLSPTIIQDKNAEELSVSGRILKFRVKKIEYKVVLPYTKIMLPNGKSDINRYLDYLKTALVIIFEKEKIYEDLEAIFASIKSEINSNPKIYKTINNV